MPDLKVLVVNDFASLGVTLQKYLNFQVDVIYLYKHPVLSLAKNPLFFVKDDLLTQISQIKSLSKEYDIFLCFGWLAAAICYLAGVNYIMYFVDEYIDSRYRLWKKMSFVKKYFYSELFKDVLKNASKTIGSYPHNGTILKKYRNDTEVIFPMVDPEMFNPNVKKIDLNENKFVFFSPQRIEESKGQLLMWKALNLTKSNFIVLQTDWGAGDYYQAAIHTKPDKVKIVPKIPRNEIPSYYLSANALLGQISTTTCGGIEREAISCKIPVFCYAANGFTENEPFYRNSTNPVDMAKYIDKMVEDENFREELVIKQSEWLKNTFNNNTIADQWEEVFQEVHQLDNHKPRERYDIGLKLFNLFKSKKVDVQSE